MSTFKAAQGGLFVFLCLPLSLLATTRNWTGSTNGNWSVAANWGGTAPVAGDDLVFANLTNINVLNNDYPAGTAFQSLTFDAATTFDPGGNSILLGAGGLTVTFGTTLNNFIPLTLAASQTWNAHGPIVLNGSANLALGSNTLTVTGNGPHVFSSTISGTGGITLGGSLTLRFNGNMSYTGPTIAGGTTHLIMDTPTNVATPITINSGAFLDDSLGFPANCNRPLTINSGGTYDVVINGSGFGNSTSITAGVAPLTLGGNLALTNTVSNPPGIVFTIIRNASGSAVTGTFAGLAEGATIVSGGHGFVVSYVGGGSGRDVTLTSQAPLTATNTSLNSTLNPLVVGQSVTFTATVAPAATGNESFFDGATPLGTIALNGSSQAAVSTSALTLGTHNITATYNGDATHSASTSPILAQVVSTVVSPVPALDARALAALVMMLGVIGAILIKR